MSDISAFLAGNVSTETTEDVIVSERFKGKDGKPVAWVLRSITEEENDAIRKAATKRSKGKGGQQVTEIDQTEYLSRMAVASVSFPNLKDAELQKSYGVLGAETLIRKMLLAGEYANLILKVQEINGFDKDINELVEEAKN
ncbi:phage tail assembly chaperone [Paenibacillus alba]|uniref:Phage portal protein n=1 Tax=Paenibacillus alba TaxID=1197127 RepID=A0ABU6GGD9_9BACL|nr:phage portal protein [Paenibacillus alba]MEC0232272.1 phage portal protein [Paenibacillus alba]NQX68066.1 phage portal protein [Paenibacillus alba]